ncbi:MAG: saccharopine dehydrogenase family protein [Flavobacteriales bacterium]
MKKIVQFGAGRSSTALIQYLLDHSEELDIQLIIVDRDKNLIEKKLNNHPRSLAVEFDINDKNIRNKYISEAEVVISMLPARLHQIIAEDCIEYSKSLFTASYLSENLKALDAKAKEKNVLFLNEIGLDPGIDHMSAKKVIDEVHEKGGKLTSFKSFCGGLIADEFDTNPWKYKFTWNPRNVVLAGNGVAQYLEHGKYKYTPYTSLFERIERMDILDYGTFEAYANRDSLSYRTPYEIEYIPTIFRGTLRKPDYCKHWNVFVKLGMTDDSYVLKNTKDMTFRAFTNSFLPYSSISLEEKFKTFSGLEDISKFEWLGLFSEEKIGLENVSPAQILQHILVPKWKLEQEDKDLIVMQHQFEYEIDGISYQHKSSFGLEGQNNQMTGMAMTVGYPLAIAVKMYLKGKITRTGVHIPVHKNIYDPILNELEKMNIKFVEEIQTVENLVH